MTSNIVLIGFMGCGKTNIGRRLANRMGHRFLDSDDLIIARTGKSIAEIFATEGEERFRHYESSVFHELLDSQRTVLATGGGAVLRAENREILHRIGIIVWLHADPEILFERASRSGKRPLLDVENPRSAFNALLQSRLSIYEGTADLKLDVGSFTQEQTVDMFINTIAIHEKNHPEDQESFN